MREYAMTKNFFPTLSEALDAVRAYLLDSRAELCDAESFFNRFALGGVNYGETKSASDLLKSYRGKEITGRMAKRGVSLTIYRMESGTYEAVCYVS